MSRKNYPSETEYNMIVAQLDSFLESSSVEDAWSCITNENLKSKLLECEKRTDRDFTTWKEVMRTIRQGIFFKDGNIFFIQVKDMVYNQMGGREWKFEEYESPTRTDNTFSYELKQGFRYTVDIKNLSSAKYNETLYIYEEGILKENGKVRAGPYAVHPVDLGAQGMLTSNTLTGGFCLYTSPGGQDPESDKDILLATSENDLVLRVRLHFVDNIDDGRTRKPDKKQSCMCTRMQEIEHMRGLLSQMKELACI